MILFTFAGLIKAMKTILFLTAVLLLCACGGSEDSSGGDVFFEDGKYQQAVEAYTDYLSTNPEHPKTLYNRGRAYEEIGETEKASKDFEKIIELDPYNINAFLSLAKLSYNEHNYNQVLHYSNKALELNENSAQANFLAARASHQLGYVDQALEFYDNAITLNKDFGDAFLYRGALKVGLKRMRSACEDFRFAQSLGVAGADDALKKYCK